MRSPSKGLAGQQDKSSKNSLEERELENAYRKFLRNLPYRFCLESGKRIQEDYHISSMSIEGKHRLIIYVGNDPSLLPPEEIEKILLDSRDIFGKFIYVSAYYSGCFSFYFLAPKSETHLRFLYKKAAEIWVKGGRPNGN